MDDTSECSDWVPTGNNGSIGKWTFTDSKWTDFDANVPHACSETRRIYCFQQ